MLFRIFRVDKQSDIHAKFETCSRKEWRTAVFSQPLFVPKFLPICSSSTFETLIDLVGPGLSWGAFHIHPGQRRINPLRLVTIAKPTTSSTATTSTSPVVHAKASSTTTTTT